MGQYARVAPEFWTGETGRQLRKLGRDAQVIALYLITGPTASPLGLYYLSLPTLCHETGINQQGAMKALHSLSEVGFCAYEGASESVFVVEMARYQITAAMKPKDNRHGWIIEEAEKLRKFPQFGAWYARYKGPFLLPEMEPLTSPLVAPAKPTPTPTPTATATTTANEKEREGAKSPRPARRVPLDFTLTVERLQFGTEQGLSQQAVGHEFAQFRDCEFSKAHSDWDATWRTWVRRATGGTNGRNGHATQRTPTASAPGASPGGADDEKWAAEAQRDAELRAQRHRA